jgi:F-type H+-transporting ATPase subunit epsilon
MSFQCTVVTPEQEVLDQSVKQVILPAFDGLIGILTDRAPMLARLGKGPLRIDPAQGPSVSYLIDGGVAQMKDNKLTILTQKAQPAPSNPPPAANT